MAKSKSAEPTVNGEPKSKAEKLKAIRSTGKPAPEPDAVPTEPAKPLKVSRKARAAVISEPAASPVKKDKPVKGLKMADIEPLPSPEAEAAAKHYFTTVTKVKFKSARAVVAIPAFLAGVHWAETNKL